MACGCGCGGNCSKQALSDDFGYKSYHRSGGYYLADVTTDDVRKIAEEEAKKGISIDSGAKILAGDFSPVIDVAERTARRVCEQGAKEELSGYIPLGIAILVGAFILGRATV